MFLDARRQLEGPLLPQGRLAGRRSALRDRVLVAAMGTDARQIDGAGGAHPLTSKVAIVSRSASSDADIDYLFVQVVVGEGRVDTTPNCGNILAGVAPFAIEHGLVEARDGVTPVRVRMLNSDNLCELLVETPGKRVNYDGDAHIDGVPGTSAPIVCNYLDVAGSATGSLLPTGRVLDVVDGIEVTCIDNGMPVVVLRARDLGVTGYETPKELDANKALKAKIESIRLQVGPRMNLGDVTNKVVPKMSLIAPARAGGHVATRTFIPHDCHAAIGVLGAVSVATACILPGSVTQGHRDGPRRRRQAHVRRASDRRVFGDARGRRHAVQPERAQGRPAAHRAAHHARRGARAGRRLGRPTLAFRLGALLAG